MKNNFFEIFIVILFVFLISGCDKTPEENIYDSYDFDYEGTVSNISAFYDLTKTFKPTNQGFDLKVDFNPKVDLIAKDLEIKIEYVVEYIRPIDDEIIYKTYDFTVTSSNEDLITNSVTINTMPFSTNHYDLFSLKIVNVKGSIYTKEEVDIVNTPEKLNKDNYDKFVLAMEEFDRISNSNYLTVSTKLENNYIKGKNVINDILDESVVKMRLSPFYMETSLLGKTSLLIEEGEYVYSFDISSTQTNGLYWINRSLFGNLSSKDEYYDYDELIESDIDTEELYYTKIKIEITETNYILSGRYKDFLAREDFQEFQSLYKSLGLPESILNDTTFSLIITIDEDNFTLETHASIPVNTSMFDVVESITTINISLNEFTTIDPFDKEIYYITKPISFNEVYEYTDVFEDVISIESSTYSQTHYYLVHLEGGQYYYNDYNQYLNLEIYNINKERVSLGEYFLQTGNHPFKYYFEVQEGDYYIKIYNRSSIGYKFKFEKLHYKDTFNANDPIILNDGTLTFEIEGNRDIVYVNYYSNKQGILKVTNNTSNFSKVYYSGQYGFVDGVFGDGTIYKIKNGNNYFYFHGDTNIYNYTIEFIEDN